MWHLTESHVASGTTRDYRYDGDDGGRALVPLVAPDRSSARLGVSQIREGSKTLVQRTFFPDGGREAVAADYWGFSYWTFVKSAISASTSVLGTQGLLRAVGVGASAAVASSAAINWVLKDGLGRIGCMLFASVIGNKFDDDAKFFVFLGDLMYEVGILLEILSPLCASFFLVIASVANAFKSMSYMSRLPPRAAILKSFAVRENVGDVSAKANSQDVVAGLFGLVLGIQVSFFVGASVWKSLCVFAASGALVCLSSLKALGHLRLNTLNRHRTEIILDDFVYRTRILSPSEVNKREGALASLGNWARRKDKDFETVFGASLRASHLTERGNGSAAAALGDLIDFYREEEYMVTLRRSKSGKKLFALVFVDPDISARSVVFALLQCAYIKNRFLLAKDRGKIDAFDEDVEMKTAFTLTKTMFQKFYDNLKDKGWVTKHVLWIPKHVVRLTQQREKGEEEEEAREDKVFSMSAAGKTKSITDFTNDPTCNSPVCETPTITEIAADAEESA